MSRMYVEFEMMNGSKLRCEYPFTYYPATYYEPSDFDAGDPVYYIDDVEVNFESLPRGLDNVANKMYEDSYNSQFRQYED